MKALSQHRHYLAELARSFDKIVRASRTPLRKLKGARGEETPLYKRFYKKQGVYVILRPRTNKVLYVGRTKDGRKEGGLADRLWGHLYTDPTLRLRLRKHHVDLDDCGVVAAEFRNSRTRRRIEHYGITAFDPAGNAE